jgi:hypothetical protein
VAMNYKLYNYWQVRATVDILKMLEGINQISFDFFIETGATVKEIAIAASDIAFKLVGSDSYKIIKLDLFTDKGESNE